MAGFSIAGSALASLRSVYDAVSCDTSSHEPDTFSRDKLEKAFLVFIRYGFKKTSMDDVARALGVSRQAIYKRYGNKNDLFSAVVNGVMHQSFCDAIAVLDETSLPVGERLISAIDRLAGHYVDHLRASPHSVEVIALVNTEKQAQADEYEAVFTKARIDLLISEGITHDQSTARDIIETMTYASKGLLHTAPDHDSFIAGLEQVVRCLLRISTSPKDVAPEDSPAKSGLSDQDTQTDYLSHQSPQPTAPAS